MRRSRALSVLISIMSCALLASAVPANADTVRSCPGNRPLGDTALWYGGMSVRNIGCRRGHRLLRDAGYANMNVQIHGWRCRLIGYYADGGIYRCTRRDRAIRFSAGG